MHTTQIGMAIAVLAMWNTSFAEVDCRTFDAAMELGAKRVALNSMAGIGERADRQTTRHLDIMAELQLISINQSLAVANNCPPRKTPIDPYVYSGEAIACLAQQAKGKPLGGACEITNWKGAR